MTIRPAATIAALAVAAAAALAPAHATTELRTATAGDALPSTRSTFAPVEAGGRQHRADACADVYFVGVRGSGQYTGMGPEMDALWTVIEQAATAAGLKAASTPVNYPAADVKQMFPSPVVGDAIDEWLAQLPTLPGLSVLLDAVAAVRSWVRNDLGPYLDSAAKGVKATTAKLNELSARCPSAGLIVAGYSQGAIALHQAEWNLARGGDVMSHVVQTVLVADGLRVSSPTREMGTATPGGRGIVQVLRPISEFAGVVNGMNARDVPSPRRTISVCDANDIVCDPGLFLLAGVSVHTQYRDGYELAQAAQLAAQRVFTPVASTVLPDSAAGTPYTAKLEAANGEPPYKWRLGKGSKLPEGLVLERDGTIHGTPTRAGNSTVTVEVTANGVVTGRAELTLVVGAVCGKPPGPLTNDRGTDGDEVLALTYGIWEGTITLCSTSKGWYGSRLHNLVTIEGKMRAEFAVSDGFLIAELHDNDLKSTYTSDCGQYSMKSNGSEVAPPSDVLPLVSLIFDGQPNPSTGPTVSFSPWGTVVTSMPTNVPNCWRTGRDAIPHPVGHVERMPASWACVYEQLSPHYPRAEGLLPLSGMPRLMKAPGTKGIWRLRGIADFKTEATGPNSEDFNRCELAGWAKVDLTFTPFGAGHAR